MHPSDWEGVGRFAAFCAKALNYRLQTCEFAAGLPFSPSVMEQAEDLAISQHFNHLIVCNIRQKKLDPYKFICWYGWHLLTNIPVVQSNHDVAFKLTTSLVATLNYLLQREPHRKRLGLNANSQSLLRRMLVNEWKGDTTHGIGMNGLYVAFHCGASDPAKQDEKE